MVIQFELTAAQEEALRATAERLGVAPEELARIAVEDLLQSPSGEFQAVIDKVLTKNRELYERLS